MKERKNQELKNHYSYHAPKGKQIEHVKINAVCHELAYLIKNTKQRSREQAVAYTHLGEVEYNANATITRNE
ncbi:Acb2/Tad1 domain-containing protein [Anaerospora hongkongensis]|uniref:Acb2/Tad1 domain-containing protein n=1 Tax=Anaerospora hongkongensis TaxID=244830 RepID=UPI00406A5A70